MEEKNSSHRKGVLQNKYFQIHLQYVSGQMTNGHIGWTLPVDKPLLGSLTSDLDDGSRNIAKLKN